MVSLFSFEISPQIARDSTAFPHTLTTQISNQRMIYMCHTYTCMYGTIPSLQNLEHP